MNLNQSIDELEFLTWTFTEASTPAVLALIKHIRHAGKEHYELFQKGKSKSDIRAFDAMFDRFQASEAAGKAAIAGVATKQVSAGAEAGQATAGAGSGPSSSSASAETAAIAELQSNLSTVTLPQSQATTLRERTGSFRFR